MGRWRAGTIVFLSIILFVLSGYINMVISNMASVYSSSPDTNELAPFHDLGFQMIGKRNVLWITDAMDMASLASVTIHVLLNERNPAVQATRILHCFTIAYLLRS